jgi:hypothetical protein
MPAVRVGGGQRSRLLAPSLGTLTVPHIGQILDSCGVSCGLGNLNAVVVVRRSPLSVRATMDVPQLLERARHYRTVAALVTDEQISRELLDLAENYEALAHEMERDTGDSKD